MTCWISYYHPPFGVVPPVAVLAALLVLGASVAVVLKRAPGFRPARLWGPVAIVLGTAMGLAGSHDAFERCPGDGEWIAMTVSSCLAYSVVLSLFSGVHAAVMRRVVAQLPRISTPVFALIGSAGTLGALVIGAWLLSRTVV